TGLGVLCPEGVRQSTARLRKGGRARKRRGQKRHLPPRAGVDLPEYEAVSEGVAGVHQSAGGESRSRRGQRRPPGAREDLQSVIDARQRVLVAYSRVGGGHLSAAHALAAELESTGRVSTKLVDA